jgi:hypothetical protein
MLGVGCSLGGWFRVAQCWSVAVNEVNKRRRVLLSIAGLVIVLVAWFVFRWRKPEPLYQGQPVSYWISQIASRNAGWPMGPPSASRPWSGSIAWGADTGAFERTNAEALPFLIATLSARAGASEVIPEKLWNLLPRNLGARFRSQRFAVDQARFLAMVSMSRMSANARDAVPVLVEVLADRQSYLRSQAAEILGNLGTAATPAVPALIRSSRDKDFLLRTTALNALRKIAPGDERVLTAFAAALGAQHKEVRFLAVEHFLARGRPTKAWLDAVVGLLTEPEASDRWRAIEVLRKSPSAILDALPVLIGRLNDENNRVRARAAMALGEAGPLAQAAAPALTKALADDYANVREAAAEALAKIAPEKAAASGQGAP